MSFLDLNPFTDGTVTVGLRRRHIAVAIISRAGRAMPADGIGDNEPRDQDEVRPICRIDPVFDISRQKHNPRHAKQQQYELFVSQGAHGIPW